MINRIKIAIGKFVCDHAKRHGLAIVRVEDETELHMLRELVGVRADASACANDAQHWLKLMAAWDENVKLRHFARDCRDNHDCDTGANGAHPRCCRCCAAEKLIGPKQT